MVITPPNIEASPNVLCGLVHYRGEPTHHISATFPLLIIPKFDLRQEKTFCIWQYSFSLGLQPHPQRIPNTLLHLI